MNTMIERLAKQAGMVQYPTGLGITENTIWGDRNIEKFAELIVRECLSVVDNKAAQYAQPTWSFEIVNDIKERFGVK